jgi:uncharacterized membrane protein
MKSDKKAYIIMLLVSTLLGAAGQLFFKVGVASSAAALVGYVLFGAFLYVVSTLIYFYVLSRTHLSWAYGFTGLSYVFASVVAFFFMGEAVPMLRWVGIAIIAIGTVFIGIS